MAQRGDRNEKFLEELERFLREIQQRPVPPATPEQVRSAHQDLVYNIRQLARQEQLPREQLQHLEAKIRDYLDLFSRRGAISWDQVEYGVVDRIFTRIGAQDDVARGESTFMVEMLETAAILRGATRRSLILFDEVGRGTSTYDGLAIARAVVEHLHARPERAAKTLFATHYHEMTALAQSLPRVRNQSVAVTEQEGRVVFLHRIVDGGADRSYGIHVAELAGMPAPVIERAREVLKTLEDASKDGTGSRRRAVSAPQLSLLEVQAAPSEVESALAEIDPDALTPLQALTKLYELRSKLRKD